MGSMHQSELLDACRRLGGKGLLRSPADSFSARVPGSWQALLATGCDDWRQVEEGHLRVVDSSTADAVGALHARVYRLRNDVDAIAVCAPPGVRLLAHFGGYLPPIFDEQVRHLGLLAGPAKKGTEESLASILRRGVNAIQMGEQVLCLGMNCERAAGNLELYEKCARAYLLAQASGCTFQCIPAYVQWIARRRLLREQRARHKRFKP